MRFSREVLYLVAGSALLLAAPVLQVARENLSSLIWHDFWVTLLVVVGAPGLLIAFLAILFPGRLGLAAAVGLTIWLSTYRLEMDVVLRDLDLPVVGEVGFVIVLLLFFPVLLLVLALLPRSLIASAIGATGLALFGLAAVELALSEDVGELLEPAIDARDLIDANPLSEYETGQASGRLPDIIYIVPDRYASSGVLAEVFNHDNGGFLDALRRRGFAVADKARANYLETHYSLAASMNMQYLGPLLQELDGKTRRTQPLYSLIQDNLVAARLKQMGYRYIHVPSWWDGTIRSAQADLTVDFSAFSLAGEFGNTAILRSPFVLLAITSIYPTDMCAALKRQLAFLENVGGDDRPTFVFAHVLAPHSPILMDAEGRCIDVLDYPRWPKGGTWEVFKAGYSGFVTYLNNRLLEIFDRQRANNPNPLIFVLQSDEGPFPKALREAIASKIARGGGGRDDAFDWREASDAQLAMKFGILNALYLGDPDGSEALPDVPETLTPVNNWRVIFGLLDGKTYPLLPDRHFIYPGSEQPYNSIEITGRLNVIAR